MSKKNNVIDLFCGAGGMSLGFQNAGFEILLGSDFDGNCLSTHKRNFVNSKFIKCDVSELKGEEILSELKMKKGEIDVIIGGPPCQGFSTVNAKDRFIDNPKNKLFKEFVRIIDETKPKCFVMENVVGLTTMENGAVKQEIINSFKEIGYGVEVKVLDAVNYGVPQYRKRAFFMGNNFGANISFPKPTHGKGNGQMTLIPGKMIQPYRTVGDSLNDIKDDDSLPNHEIPIHDEVVLKRMSYVKEGGTQADIPDEHKPPQQFKNTYGRLDRKKPSYTIHTRFDVASTGSLFHPTKNRALTVREGAKLQSFPDNFVFNGLKSSRYRQVGNAVPPLLAQAIANEIIKMLEKNGSGRK